MAAVVPAQEWSTDYATLIKPPDANLWQSIAFVLGLIIPYPALAAIRDQEIWTAFPYNIPDMNTIVLMHIRGVIDPTAYYDLMKKSGFNTEKSDLIFSAAQRIFDVGELVASKRRGIITEDEFTGRMHKAGILSEDIKIWDKVTEYFPNPNDLIRFAVREVYTPSIVSAYRMDEDFPEEFVTEAAKAGLPKKQAVNYWRAHWELPAVNLGLEMHHRLTANPAMGEGDPIVNVRGTDYYRTLSLDSLKTLLRTLDIMPYWREKLSEIIYTPLTRVDVRRMFRAGVLDRDDVFKNYCDLGYSEENSELMTLWTIKEYTDETRDLNKSEILSAFKADKIGWDKALNFLMSLDYAEEDAVMILSVADSQKTTVAKDEAVAQQTTLYVNGIQNLASMQDTLNKMNIDPRKVRTIITAAEKQKQQVTKLPSKEDLGKWLKDKLITPAQYLELMQRLGYLLEHIKLYYEDITGKELVTTT